MRFFAKIFANFQENLRKFAYLFGKNFQNFDFENLRDGGNFENLAIFKNFASQNLIYEKS